MPRGSELTPDQRRQRLLTRLLGGFLLLLSAAMLPSLVIAFAHGELDRGAFAATLMLIAPTGWWCFRYGRSVRGEISRRDGFLLVTAAWFISILIGAMPFYFFGHRVTLGMKDRGVVASYPAPMGRAVHGRCELEGAGDQGAEFCSLANCVFESASGFTTTGATILEQGLWTKTYRKYPRDLPHGLLFWRNVTQWLGGMGIIVLAVALLPLLGIGGMQLFRAEVPGPTAAKLVPRVGETARVLWGVYGVATALVTVLLLLSGSGLFLSVTHALSTVATAGFSPLAASVGGLGSAFAEYVIIAFMLFCGANFALHHRSLHDRRLVHLGDPEFRLFGVIVLAMTAVMFGALWWSGTATGWTAFRQSLFTVASLATTTGYANVDYGLWIPSLPVLALCILAFSTLGGCAGSTSGGVKVIRLALGVQLAVREFYRLIHPRGVRPVRLGDQHVDYSVVDGVASFLVLFFILALLGSLWLAAEGFTPIESLSASLSMLANVGPSLGQFGPAGHYNAVSDVGKMMLSSLMILGRLELLTVLVLLTRDFWR